MQEFEPRGKIGEIDNAEPDVGCYFWQPETGMWATKTWRSDFSPVSIVTHVIPDYQVDRDQYVGFGPNGEQYVFLVPIRTVGQYMKAIWSAQLDALIFQPGFKNARNVRLALDELYTYDKLDNNADLDEQRMSDLPNDVRQLLLLSLKHEIRTFSSVIALYLMSKHQVITLGTVPQEIPVVKNGIIQFTNDGKAYHVLSNGTAEEVYGMWINEHIFSKLREKGLVVKLKEFFHMLLRIS